jgi:hypothetical protein
MNAIADRPACLFIELGAPAIACGYCGLRAFPPLSADAGERPA